MYNYLEDEKFYKEKNTENLRGWEVLSFWGGTVSDSRGRGVTSEQRLGSKTVLG